jgi:hypothetical protein
VDRSCPDDGENAECPILLSRSALALGDADYPIAALIAIGAPAHIAALLVLAVCPASRPSLVPVGECDAATHHHRVGPHRRRRK